MEKGNCKTAGNLSNVDIKNRTQSLNVNSLGSKYRILIVIQDDKCEEKSDSLKAPDGNWGWIIVLSSFLIQFIIIGFDGCSGIMFLKFQDKYKTSTAITAWLGSLATALRLLLGPLASGLSNRFSERTVIMMSGLVLSVSMILTGLAPNIYYTFLSFGILGGIGRSFAYCPAIVMVGIYFKKKQGLTTGIAASGCGVGGFALTILVALLFKQYDFLGAFIVMGGIALEIVALGALMRPVRQHITDISKRKKIINIKQSMNNNNYIHPGSISISIPDKMESKNISKSFCDNEEDEQEEKTQIFDFSVLTNIRFLGFCITMLLSSLAEQSAFVFLPAFAEEIGVLGDQSSEYTVAITSVFSSLAKVLTGFLFDCSLVKPYRVYLYNVLMSGLVVIYFVIPSVTTFSQLAIVCGLYGLCAGSYKAQKSVVIVDILGQDKLKHSFGILMMFQGIGSLIGPPLSGLFKDIHGNYDVAFYIGGIGVLVGTLILFINNIVHCIRTRQDKKRINRINNLKFVTSINSTKTNINFRSCRHST